MVRQLVLGGPSYWRLKVKPSYGNSLGGTAVCITATANKVNATWNVGSPATSITGGGATRRCFLSSVKNVYGFTSSTDYVRTWKDTLSNTWHVGGSQQSGSSSGVTAGAVCVDVPNQDGLLTRTVANEAAFTGNLAYNSESDGTSCGLSKLGGRFQDNDFNDGIWIHDDSGTRYWKWTLRDEKSGEARCVR